MFGIVGGVHPLAIELGCNVSGQAHRPAFFANGVSTGFGIDGNQQRRVFNVRRLSLRGQDVGKREPDEDECENVKPWGLRHRRYSSIAETFLIFLWTGIHLRYIANDYFYFRLVTLSTTK